MLRRKKAFTLIELMVVVSIIALLAMMLVPALQRALEMTRRASCLANLKGAGTALALYSQANDNIYPMLPGKGWDINPDGTVWSSKTSIPTGVATDWDVARSVTSLEFMLVRNGESPKLFCCPSDGNATPDGYTTDNTNNGAWNWDFSCGQGGTAPTGISNVRNTSYSYECPLDRGAAAADTNGVPVGADSSMVVMADRNPQTTAGNSLFGIKSPGGAFTGASAGTPSSADWAANMAPNVLHYYNSQNHSSGEMMNVLYVDGHAARVNNPNCGPTQANDTAAPGGAPDCIFTASSTHTITSDGIDYGGTCANTDHAATALRDTYLWGGAGR